MRFYVAFAMNLAALTINVSNMIRDERGPSVWSIAGAVMGLIGIRVMFPIVVRELRGKK